MVCTNCGTDNRAARKFCRECGEPLPQVCPHCGSANDRGDKYCGACGLPLDATATSQAEDEPLHDPHERRFVVVLFADLVGFTPFTEGRDPEDVRATLTTYFDRAREIVERFGGTVEKFIGDAVMAVWGAPIAHEDDAERAVRAGLELVDAVARIGAELGHETLSIRAGVLSGEASVAPANTQRGFVVGDMVNTAARLQAVAEPGTVVVGEATFHMLHSAIEFAPLGAHALKGKAEPVEVWRAVRLKTDRTRPTASGGVEPPFVGRERELRLLKDALHAAEEAGRGRLVSIFGEAGIGKTRLAWEFRKYVGGLVGDVYWHEGRSPAYDQGLTLWSLSEMVRQRAGIAETDDVLRSRTKLRTAVAEYVPAPADQEWIEPRLAGLLGLADVPTGERGEIFAAIRAFFQSIAARGTAVLVFEDFHWADSGLYEFVTELVEHSSRHPILVVTLARPDLFDRVPGWGSSHRNSMSVHLGPLTHAEMHRLVEGMVQGIDAATTNAIASRANGVPLFAVELVRMLLADGALEPGEGCCVPTRDLSSIPVPNTVRAVIEARLDRLPAPTRTLLLDAAVLGAAFTCAGLAAMSGLPLTDVDERLEPLVHREVLELESDPRSPERGQYRFVQSMIREVAYGRLTRDERKVRHIRAAEFYRELGELELTGAVGSHYMAAHRLATDVAEAAALAASATSALSEAAERAAALHSHAQSLVLIEQALAFVTDPEAKPPLWQRAARSAAALARRETAIGYAYQALDWYREQGDAVDVANSAALVGSVLCHAYRAPEAIEVIEPVVRAGGDLAEPGVAGAAAQLARAYLMALRDADAAVLGDRVIESAERLELIPVVVDGLITRGTALGNLGRLHEAIALLEGATRYARDYELPVLAMRAANNLAHLQTYDDQFAAMDACRAGLEQADRIGDVGFLGSFTFCVASYLDLDGRFEEAHALREETLGRIELPASSVAWYALSDLMPHVVRGEAGALDQAIDALRQCEDEADPQADASVRSARARLYLLAGRFDEAFEQATSVGDVLRYPEHLATALLAAGLSGNAAGLDAISAGLDVSPVRGRMVQVIRTATAACRAALAGRTDEAVAGFVRALEHRSLRLDRAQVQGLFAAVVGLDTAEARRASDEAFAAFSEVGATVYLDLFAAGMPPAPGRLAAGS